MIRWPTLNELYILRKFLPIIYIVLSLNNLPIVIVSVILLLIDWSFRLSDRYGLPLTIINSVIIPLLIFPINIVLAAVVSMVLDSELRRNNASWWIMTMPYLISSLIALYLTRPLIALCLFIPGAYMLIITLISWVLYSMAYVELSTKLPIRSIVNNAVTYVLELRTRPRIHARFRIMAPENFTVEPSNGYINGAMELSVKAFYDTTGIKRPVFTIKFIDPRGLIEITKEVPHPEILVMPGSAYVYGYYGRIMSSKWIRDVGDVIEVREYIPGDPIRRIHWKKYAKLDNLVIKLFTSLTRTLIIIPYVTNSIMANKLNSAVLYTVSLLVDQRVIPRIVILDPFKGAVANVQWSDYIDLFRKLSASIRNLNINFKSASYDTYVFTSLRRSRYSEIVRLLMRYGVSPPYTIIGEDRFTLDVINALTEAVSKGNVNYILIR